MKEQLATVQLSCIKGSSFAEFKGVIVTREVALAEVLDVIQDVKNYESLFSDCVNPRILKQDGRFYDIHSIEVKTPWQVKSRDAIYEQRTTLSANQKHARIELVKLNRNCIFA